jgi:hypothetical protein
MSVDLWDHTLATLFATAAVWFIASAGEGNAVRRFALAGLASGLAIAVREELYAVIPAGLVALAWLPADDAAARAFAAAGWREARRTSVQAWLEVLFVEYRRDDGAASAATP